MKRKSIRIWSFLLSSYILVASSGFAKELEKEVVEASTFRANKWTRGVHLLGSLGLNAFSLDFKGDDEEDQDPDNGLGGNFQSSIGYYFLNAYAIEAGSNVMLSRAHGFLIWETMLTIGARLRLPSFLGPDNSAPFLRLHFGKGPSVFIIEDSSDVFEGDDRLHLEGDIYGLSYGFFRTTKGNLTWFLEANASLHIYRYAEYVVENDEVSDVYFSNELDGKDRMSTLSLGLGVVIF